MVLDDEKQAELEAICGRLGIPNAGPTIGSSGYPIDVGKPNIHDSKAEFLKERETTAELYDSALKILDAIIGVGDQADDEKEMRGRLTSALDNIAARKVTRNPFSQVTDFLRNAAAQQGLTITVTVLLLDLAQAIRERIQELDSQEAVFWQQKHRPPNHYARTIALRLAKRIAQAQGKKPTVGTSRDGGHPSTDFTRALEQVFSLLDIEAKVVHPAKWAVAQLTDEDLKPPRNALLQFAGRNALAIGSPSPAPQGILSYINELSPKGK